MGLEYMYHKTGDALAMGCKKNHWGKYGAVWF